MLQRILDACFGWLFYERCYVCGHPILPGQWTVSDISHIAHRQLSRGGCDRTIYDGRDR